MTRDRILVAIPAYQAAPFLGPVLDDCKTIAKEIGAALIVIDDGSTDGTSDLARDRGVEVAPHPFNQGKGSAIRTAHSIGMSRDVDAVVTLDADGQHLPRNIPRLLEEWRTRRADLIIGSRAHLFSEMVRRRRMANRFSASTISFAAGTPIADTQSGFRVYDRNFIRRVRFVSGGFAAESEMLVVASRLGLTIAEVPIDLGFVDGVATSHYRAVLDTLRIAGRVAMTAATLEARRVTRKNSTRD